MKKKRWILAFLGLTSASLIAGMGLWWKERPEMLLRSFLAAVAAGEVDGVNQLLAEPARLVPIRDGRTGFEGLAEQVVFTDHQDWKRAHENGIPIEDRSAGEIFRGELRASLKMHGYRWRGHISRTAPKLARSPGFPEPQLDYRFIVKRGRIHVKQTVSDPPVIYLSTWGLQEL